MKLSGAQTNTANITGTVTDSATFSPIQNASVAVDTGLSSITNAEGKYTLSNVPTGNRTIAISAEGYVPQETQVTVSEIGGNEVDIELVAEKGGGGPNCNNKPDHPKC